MRPFSGKVRREKVFLMFPPLMKIRRNDPKSNSDEKNRLVGKKANFFFSLANIFPCTDICGFCLFCTGKNLHSTVPLKIPKEVLKTCHNKSFQINPNRYRHFKDFNEWWRPSWISKNTNIPIFTNSL